MRTRLIFRSILLMFVMLAAPAAARAQALADRVPDDALLYASWTGATALQPAYQGSHLKAVIDNTTVPEFLQDKLPLLVARVAEQDREAGDVLKKILDAGTVMAKYPSAFYLGTIDLKNGPPMPRLALLCAAGADSATLETQINALVAKAGDAPFPVAVKREGGAVLLEVGTLGDASEALLLGKAGAAAPALAADPLFKATVAQMGPAQKSAAFTIYVNAPGFIKLIDQGVQMAPPPVAEKWTAVRDMLNLNGFQGAMISAGFDGKDWCSQIFIGATGPRAGLLAMLDSKPITDDQFKQIPVTATWASAWRFDLAGLVNQIITGVEKAVPESKGEIDDAIGKANEALGMDIQQDLLANFGDQWESFCAPDVAGTGLWGLNFVNQVKDPAKLSAALDAMENMINAEIRKHMHRGDPQFLIQKTDLGGVEVHSVGLVFVTPAWAVKNGNFYLALMPQAIPAAVDTTAGAKTSLLDNPDFIALRQRLGVDKPASLQFVDLPKTAPDSYPMLVQIVGLMSLFGGADTPPSLVPPLHKLLPELDPMGMASWSDDAGWHWKMISPLPGSILLSGQQNLGMASPAIMAAILLPSLGRARELANRSADGANMSGIAKGCIMYSIEHNDDMPKSLAELVALDMISPKMLVRPGSGTAPAVLTAEQSQAATADWHAIEKIIDEHCDYIYLGKGTKNNTDSSQVLIVTKPLPGLGQDGMNMAFYDAHVEWTRPPSYAATLQHTNEARKAAGLDQVDPDSLREGPPPPPPGRRPPPPPPPVGG